MTAETKENIKQGETVNLYRLTRPTTLGRFAPRIEELRNMVARPEITYEGLYCYFVNTVQQSEYLIPKGIKPIREFTLVVIDDIPAGFAHWYVKPPPLHIATAQTDFIHVWNGNEGKALEALINRFIAFGRRHNCEYFHMDYYFQPEVKNLKALFESKKMTYYMRESQYVYAQEAKKK